jgi:hypothetical protein
MQTSFTLATLATAAFALQLNGAPNPIPPPNASYERLNLQQAHWKNFCLAWEDT